MVDASGFAVASAERHPRWHSLVSARFKSAASYLLEEPLGSRHDGALILVEDSDVGPILTHPRDTEIGARIRTARTWSPGEGRYLRNVLRPGMNVIDVGANIGYFTLLMARAVGAEGSVLAIEPDPETFRILRANLALGRADNVEALPVAATRGNLLVTMSRSPENLGAHKGFVEPGAADLVPVQGIRLDDVLARDSPIGFIKIDIEGMDHAAIEGLARTIQRWKPTLLAEFNPANIEAFGDDPHDVLALYRDYGLEIAVLGPDLLLLRDHAEFDADELIRDNMIVLPANDRVFVERIRRIGLVNLILKPRVDRAT